MLTKIFLTCFRVLIDPWAYGHLGFLVFIFNTLGYRYTILWEELQETKNNMFHNYTLNNEINTTFGYILMYSYEILYDNYRV